MSLKWPTKHVLLAAGTPPPDDPPPPISGLSDGITRHGGSPAQLFSPTSWINAPLPSNVAIDSRSSAAVAALVSQASIPSPYFGAQKYSARVVRWDPSATRVPCLIRRSGTLPNWAIAMQEILMDPGAMIPPDYVNQGDSDDSFCVYCPEDNLAQEFWRLRPIDPATNNGVSWMCQGMWNFSNLSTHPARSRNNTQGAVYPHAPLTTAKRKIYEDTSMSLTAGRIPLIGTLLTVEDLQRGQVDHALGMSAVYSRTETFNSADPNKGYQWPASSSDGFSAKDYPVREGDRYRFPPGYTIPSNVHPICQRIIQGVRDYGLVLTDKAGTLEIDGEAGCVAYLNGTPNYQILNGFPWGDLQLLAMGSDATPNPLA